MKIALIDDSAYFRDRLIAIIDDIGGIEEIRQAGDAQEGIDLIREQNPDVVILDIRMPGKTGIDVLKEINKNYPETTVIILTGYPYPQYRKKCMDLGSKYFFNKSTEVFKVSEVLKSLTKVSNNSF